MIIRNQDKKSITTDLNLTIYEDDWTHKFEITNNLGMELGLYSTEGKAIKVLDMIQDAYLKPVYQNIIGENETAVYQCKLFKMPADEDVEV